jgi:hypothetical protein
MASTARADAEHGHGAAERLPRNVEQEQVPVIGAAAAIVLVGRGAVTGDEAAIPVQVLFLGAGDVVRCVAAIRGMVQRQAISSSCISC